MKLTETPIEVGRAVPGEPCARHERLGGTPRPTLSALGSRLPSRCFALTAKPARLKARLHKTVSATTFALVALFAIGASSAIAREVIPPAPPRYFNDFAGVVPADTQAQLNDQLAQFERDTSNQIVVAIYPTMQSDSSLEDYTQRVYQAWQIGQKGRNNGALLLVFTQSHRMRIHTGYGLEGALPDALCARIMRDDIAPHLRAGDWAGGMRAGVNAMMAAARGEYKGTGHTVADSHNRGTSPVFPVAVIFLILVMMAIGSARQRARSVVYGRRGRMLVGPTWWGGGGWGGGGGGWSGGGGGGSSWGGGGGFSGGGGSSGGGGASGSW